MSGLGIGEHLVEHRDLGAQPPRPRAPPRRRARSRHNPWRAARTASGARSPRRHRLLQLLPARLDRGDPFGGDVGHDASASRRPVNASTVARPICSPLRIRSDSSPRSPQRQLVIRCRPILRIDRRISTRRDDRFGALVACASCALPRKAMSLAMPARRSVGEQRQAPRLPAAAPSGHDGNDRRSPASRRLDQHRQPLDPGRPADRRRRRAAEAFDQAVIAAAGDHRALRAEPVGDELEGGVAIIIEAADQARRCASRRRRRRRGRP